MRSSNDDFTYQGGSEDPGPVCTKFLTTLKSIQQEKTKDAFEWLDDVKDREMSLCTNGLSTGKVSFSVHLLYRMTPRQQVRVYKVRELVGLFQRRGTLQIDGLSRYILVS